MSSRSVTLGLRAITRPHGAEGRGDANAFDPTTAQTAVHAWGRSGRRQWVTWGEAPVPVYGSIPPTNLTMTKPVEQRVPLSTIVREWSRIGLIGFGGPPAHIALLRKLCVEDRHWLARTSSRTEFRRPTCCRVLLQRSS